MNVGSSHILSDLNLQLQQVFYPPQIATIYAFLFVVLSAFFLMNLTIAVLWSTFSSSMDSEDVAEDAKEMMKSRQEMGLLPDGTQPPAADSEHEHDKDSLLDGGSTVRGGDADVSVSSIIHFLCFVSASGGGCTVECVLALFILALLSRRCGCVCRTPSLLCRPRVLRVRFWLRPLSPRSAVR